MPRIWHKWTLTLLTAALLCGCGGQPTQPQNTPPVLPDPPAVSEVQSAAPDQPVPEVESPEPDTADPLPQLSSPEPPAPSQPEPDVEAGNADEGYTCTISISCAVLLEHLEDLPSEKAGLVPEDGWVLPSTQVPFEEGETVFDILQRVCQQQKLHMEFSSAPGYDSAYIEGIHNLYEFDCGSLSGWMYHVNGQFPNYGCNHYSVQNGDMIAWEYTCDLGEDVRGRIS